MSAADVEPTVRAMTKRERADYLREHGWFRLSSSGAQCWFSPGWTALARRGGTVTDARPSETDRAFYSLTAAIHTAVNAETTKGDTA